MGINKKVTKAVFCFDFNYKTVSLDVNKQGILIIPNIEKNC